MARSFAAGSSQSIAVPSAASINFGTGDFTVLVWVRFPVEPPDAAMIVGKRAGGFDGNEGWELKINDGGNETYRWDVETDVTGRQRAEGTLTGINDGNWHLIGGDHTDGTPSQLQLWYDGAVAATKVANTPGTVDTATPMVIAAAYNTPNTNYLTGEIGPVFGCPRLLTLAEHQALAAGFSARFLRPTPCFLMELTHRGSPEVDIGRGGLYGTLGNSPGIVDNPRIVYPVEPQPGPGTWFEPISALIEGQSALSATIVRSRAASAQIDGQSAVSASLSAEVPLSATITGQSTITADISPDAAIKATISGQSAITATATLDKHLRARVDGRSGVSARATYDAAASATIAGQSAIAVNEGVDVPISATIAGQSGITAAGSRSRGLSAQIDGQSSLTASPNADHGMSATIWGQGALSALLAADAPVSAVIVGQGALAATLSADAPLSATIAGQSALSATIVRSRAGSATIAGQSTVAASASADCAIAAVMAAQSSISADAAVDAAISATIAGQSDLAATLRKLGEPLTQRCIAEVSWRETTGGKFI